MDNPHAFYAQLASACWKLEPGLESAAVKVGRPTFIDTPGKIDPACLKAMCIILISLLGGVVQYPLSFECLRLFGENSV